MGLIATKTIAEGDTREGSLLHIVKHGGNIYRADTRYRWPGDSSIIVTVAHLAKSPLNKPAVLNGDTVGRISAYLRHGEVDDAPLRLNQNPFYSKGSLIYGQGFLFDDSDQKSSPMSVMAEILRNEPALSSRITMFVGGEDVNRDPRHLSRRFVIDLNDVKSEFELEQCGQLVKILKNKVLPERMALGNNPNNRPLKARWWAHQAHRPSLYARIKRLRRVLGIARVTPHVAFTFLPTDLTFAEKVILFEIEDDATFAVLQSRIHDTWARYFTSSLGETLNYAASDCYETFPFPEGLGTNPILEAAGGTYYIFRAKLMLERNEGLTKTYNRFHDRRENAPDIARLRTLHAEMDTAVLRTYGWDGLTERATPVFIEQEADEGKPAKTRLDWPDEIKDELLAKLLALNAERAAAEKAQGVSAAEPVEDDKDLVDDEEEIAEA